MSDNTSFSLESALREIRSILDQMQSATPDFDQNVKLFTRGTDLIQQCRTWLDASELRIKQITDGENGPELKDMDV